MSNTYSTEQQIHSLALLTNAAGDQKFPQPSGGPCAKPDAADNMQQYVGTVVTKVLSQDQEQGGSNYLGTPGNSWECVWGPVVYCNKPISEMVVADNTMALYYNSKSNAYVIGIAGTNPISTYGWFSEDFDVSTTTPWNALVHNTQASDKACLSAGAETGLNILLDMEDAGNLELTEFLAKDLASRPANVTLNVAGHSLGGALTQVLSLYLYETAATWNTKNIVSQIIAYPTAGPTVTNEELTNYFKSKTGLTQQGTLSLNYLARINDLDIIPQAWDFKTLSNAPYTYDNCPDFKQYRTTPEDNMTAMLVSSMIMKSYNTSKLSFNNYSQIWTTGCTVLNSSYQSLISILGLEKSLAIHEIPNVFRANTVLAGSPLAQNYPEYLRNFIVFSIQAIYQHTTAYNKLLNITQFMDEYATIKKTVPGPLVKASTQHEIPVNEFLQRFLGNPAVTVPGKVAVPQAL